MERPLRLSYAYEQLQSRITFTTVEFQHIPDIENIITGQDIVKLIGLQISEEVTMRYYDDEAQCYFLCGVNDCIQVQNNVVKVLIRDRSTFQVNQKRIEDLEKEVNNYKALQPQNQLETKPSHTDILDIAILYAAPLVYQGTNGKSVQLHNTDLGFSETKSDIINILRKCDQDINIRFETATAETLKEVLEQSPKIVQLHCYGCYKEDPNDQEFYLALESSTEYGLIDYMSSAKLRAVLESVRNWKGILVISSYSATPIGKLFLHANYPCVLWINNVSTQLPRESQNFLFKLYQGLFNGTQTIEECYEAAKPAVQSINCDCLRIHDPNCLWIAKQRAEKLTFENAHSIHSFECGCTNKFLGEHDYRWEPAIKFRQYYHPNLAETEIIQVRCCQLESDHSNNPRFFIGYGDDSMKRVELFPRNSKNSGNVNILNETTPLVKPSYTEIDDIAGRHVQLYELAQVLKSNTRIITVGGEAGIGKSHLLKASAEYLYKRHFFKHGIAYFMLKGRTDVESLYTSIAKQLRINQYKHQKIQSSLYNTDICIIFDGMDSMIRHEEHRLRRTIDSLIANTKMPKFVIVTKIPSFAYQIGQRFNVEPLSRDVAARLLIQTASRQRISDADRKRLMTSSTDNIMNYIGTSPSEIRQVVPLIGLHGFQAFKVEFINRYKKEQSEEKRKILALTMSLDEVSKSPGALELLQILCHFPMGLLSLDLDILYEMQCLGTWVDAIGVIEVKKHQISRNHLSKKQSNKPAPRLMRAASKKGTGTHRNIEAFFLVNIEKNQINKETLYSAINNVKDYIVRTVTPDVRAQCNKYCIDYLSLLSRSLIKAIKNEHSENGTEIHYKFANFNASLDEGIWQSQVWPAELVSATAEKLTNPKERFMIYEDSFQYFLHADRLRHMLNCNDFLPEQYGEKLSEMALCVSSLYILQGAQSFHQAVEVAYMGKQLCKQFQNLENQEAVLRLVLAYACHLSGDINCTLKWVNRAYTILQRQSSESSGSDNLSESGLAESYSLLGLVKTTSLDESMSSSSASYPVLTRNVTSYGDSAMLKPEHYFDQSIERFKGLSQEIGHAQAIMFNSDRLYDHLETGDIILDNENFIEELTYAHKIFAQSSNKVSYQIRCLYLIAESYFLLEKNFNQAKIIYVQALELAQRIKHHDEETRISKRITTVNDEIRKQKQNTISLSKAFPLVRQTSDGLAPVCMSRYPSQFRQNLTKRLWQIGKEVNIRFDIGSTDYICSNISQGSRILHFTSDLYSDSSLIFEGEDGLAEEVPIQDLGDVLGSNLSRNGVDVVVIALPFSLNIAEHICHQLRTPYVIGFDFEEYPQENHSSLLQILYEETIYEFCIEFYARLMEGSTVQAAFEGGRERMIATFMDRNNQKQAYSIKQNDEFQGRGAILVSSDDTNRRLFTSERHKESEFCTFLQDGTLNNISRHRSTTNLEKKDTCYIGRDLDLHKAINLLKKNKVLNVYGPPGIGKSTFMHFLGYQYQMRDVYADGIYFLDLSKIYQIKQLSMELQKLGNIDQSFENKNILFLLDNWDNLIRQGLDAFLNQLASYVIGQSWTESTGEHNISIVFTHRFEIKKPNLLPLAQMSLEKLSNRESAVMLLQSWQKPVLRSVLDPRNMQGHRPVEEIIEEHKLILQCRGIPEEIMKKAGEIDTFGWEQVEQEGKRQQQSPNRNSLPVDFGNEILPLLRAQTSEGVCEEDFEDQFEPASLSFTVKTIDSGYREDYSPTKLQQLPSIENEQGDFEDLEDFKQD